MEVVRKIVDAKKLMSVISLVGVIRDTGMTLEDYRAERLGKYENLD